MDQKFDKEWIKKLENDLKETKMQRENIINGSGKNNKRRSPRRNQKNYKYK
ncbi:MAG: hypothetical protein ACRC4M_05960 [Mycoplasma sp.]